MSYRGRSQILCERPMCAVQPGVTAYVPAFITWLLFSQRPHDTPPNAARRTIIVVKPLTHPVQLIL